MHDMPMIFPHFANPNPIAGGMLKLIFPLQLWPCPKYLLVLVPSFPYTGQDFLFPHFIDQPHQTLPTRNKWREKVLPIVPGEKGVCLCVPSD